MDPFLGREEARLDGHRACRLSDRQDRHEEASSVLARESRRQVRPSCRRRTGHVPFLAVPYRVQVRRREVHRACRARRGRKACRLGLADRIDLRLEMEEVRGPSVGHEAEEGRGLVRRR